MTLQENQHLMQRLNQEYHKEMKPRLLGEQWRERQKKWLEVKKVTQPSKAMSHKPKIISGEL